MTKLWNDIQFGLRMLIKTPGFTATAALSLALGIGAAATLFSVFHALVIDPFPYPRSEQIAYVRSNSGQPLSTPDFKDIYAQNTSFAHLGVYETSRLNFGAERPESLPAVRCTAGILPALGVKPVLGRWLEATDEKTGAAPVAVISHALWIRAFQGDSGILGRTIRLDGRETEVVGVMPAGFEFAASELQGRDFEAWVPLILNDQQQTRDAHWLLGIGQLKEGIGIEAADAEIKAIGARLARAYPATNTRIPMLVRSIREEITRETAKGMQPQAVAMALLLLVACANVAGLLLARGVQRQEEFGLRMALGASRTVLIRQLLSESVLLGLLGCITGILFAWGGVSVIRQWIPSAMIMEARRSAIQVNGTVLLFAVILGLASALAAALFPAFRITGNSPAGILNGGGRTQTGSPLRHRFLRTLTVAQIAVAMALAQTGILCVVSYQNVFRTNEKMNTHQVLTAEIVSQGDGYREVAGRIRFWNALIEHVKTLPGVQYAGLTTKLPLEGGSNFDVLIDNQKFDPAVRRPLVENSGVSPDYFAAMGLGWLRGQLRDFSSDESAEIPVVINQTMARKCWPDADPIGRQVRINSTQMLFQFKVVGVVEDVRQWGAESAPRPELYYACTLSDTPEDALPDSAYLVVRSSGDTRNLTAAIRHELAAIDSTLPLNNVRTMGDVLHSATGRRRLSAGLINLFLLITLLLTAIGIYGTLSFLLLQRTHEIGVRMAVGAQRSRIFLLVVRQAGSWLLCGLALGLALSTACFFLVRSMVYAVHPLHPLWLLSGVGLVGSTVYIACLMPALRAAKIEPMKALRCE